MNCKFRITAQKMKIFSKDSAANPANIVTFTKEILKGTLMKI